MSPFLQPTYWLTLQPPDVAGLVGNIALWMFVGFLVLGVISRMVIDRRAYDRYKRDVGSRMSTLLTTMGILGMLLYFFSFEGIQLFGARIWYPVWIIATVLWFLLLVRYVKCEIPAQRDREMALRERSKYLPQQHRR
jgi:hypothetical protein